MSSIAPRSRPAALITALLVIAVICVRWQGRVWWCACGRWNPVSFTVNSMHNSQHLFDAYSLSHVLHGILFFGLLWLARRRLSLGWRFAIAAAIEIGWEMMENSPVVINRYPQFYDIPDSSPDGSKLLFTYRNGSSGSGNQYVNVYNPATNSWTNREVVNGNATSVNAYLNSMAYTSTSDLLMSWTWRSSPSWQTNSNIMFAQSPDNGTSWYRQGGTTPYTLPIIQSGSPATSVAQVVKAIPQNSSLINQTSMTVDGSDNPLIATWYAPNWIPATSSGDPNRQYMLVYYDGDEWRTSQITNRTTDTAIDTSAFAVRDLGRPIVLTDDKDHVLVVTRSTDTAMGNYDDSAVTDNELVVYYNTLSSLRSENPGAWQSVALDTANMGSMEPTYDAALWKSQRKLSLFYQQMGLGQSSSPVSVLDWDSIAYFNTPFNHWNIATGGNWDTAGNWSLGVPDSVAALASFGTGVTAPSADSVITLDGSKTLGSLTFNSPTYGYNLVAGVSGALVLNNGAATAAIVNVNSGSHTIAVPVSLSGAGNDITTTGSAALTVSGNVTGSGGIRKTGNGTLLLSGDNSYSGASLVAQGVLHAGGAALSANSNLELNGGLFGSSVNRTLGTGAGQIKLPGGSSGFTANGADIVVTLHGGGGAAVQWGSATFNPQTLVLNNAAATHSVTLTSALNLGNSTRPIAVGASAATLSGVISGTGSLTKDLAGTLVLSAANTYTGATTVNAGMLHVTGSIGSTSAVNFGSGGSGIVRVGVTGGLGNGAINIASNGASFGPTSRLELSGGVTLGNPITLAQRNNSSVAIQSLGGDNALTGATTIAVGGNQARVQVDSGQLALAGPISTTATSPRNLYLQGAGAGTVSGVISDNAVNAAGRINVIKEGAGTWTLSGANTYTGTSTVNAGTLVLANNLTNSSGITVNGGKLEVSAGAGSNRVLKTPSVTIAASGRIDLRDNRLLTDTPAGTFNGTSYTGIQGEVARAYNFGTCDLPGLMTSELPAGPNAGPLSGTTTIGVATAAQVLFIGATDTGTFAGQTVTGTMTIAMYTYAGDLNFDGLVDAAGYGVIDNWIQFPGTDGYPNGDLNYDGVIDASDYGIIDNTIQLQGPPIPTGVDAVTSAIVLVPEPTCALAMLASSLLLRRRRRQCFG